MTVVSTILLEADAMMTHLRRGFALLVAAPFFVFLAWFFGIFLHPQGAAGAGTAIVLVLCSAIAALIVFRWLASPGPKAQFRHRGVDGVDNGVGIGMMGLSEHDKAERRREDHPGDHPGDFGGDDGGGDGGD
jgi:hypothetical protein